MSRMSALEQLPFAASVTTGPDRATVRLTGELDLATKPDLLEAIGAAEASGLPVLRVDMRDLVFIDSTGISCLLQLTDRGRKHVHRVEFVITDGTVDRTLRISGVHGLLPRAA